MLYCYVTDGYHIIPLEASQVSIGVGRFQRAETRETSRETDVLNLNHQTTGIHLQLN